MSATSPSQGARSTFETGSMEMPSPTIFSANTGSGTCSIGTSTPESGATSTTLARPGDSTISTPSWTTHVRPDWQGAEGDVTVLRVQWRSCDGWTVVRPVGGSAYP